MNKFNITAIAVAIALAFSCGAMAQTMSKDEYKSAQDSIAAEHKSATGACGSLSGNANDICKAEAGGKEKVAKAELEARYKPSTDARYEVRTARAEANYSITKEKCDDKAGNAKDSIPSTAHTAPARAALARSPLSPQRLLGDLRFQQCLGQELL